MNCCCCETLFSLLSCTWILVCHHIHWPLSPPVLFFLFKASVFDETAVCFSALFFRRQPLRLSLLCVCVSWFLGSSEIPLWWNLLEVSFLNTRAWASQISSKVLCEIEGGTSRVNRIKNIPHYCCKWKRKQGQRDRRRTLRLTFKWW